MLDWLAVGWNLAMSVSGAFMVSLTFREWPLVQDRRHTPLPVLLATIVGLLIACYPHPVVTVSAPAWLEAYGDLRFVPLVALVLTYRPVWALAAALLLWLPQLADHLNAQAPFRPGQLVSLTGVVGVLLVAALQKRGANRLSILNSSPRAVALRLPLIFLPCGLPYLLTLGWAGGLIPALLLTALNLLGFLAGALVLRSRFSLLATGARLSRQALTDPLTGLWNRRQLEQDLLELPEYGHILVMDLDYFKTINDRFGHDVGDGYLLSAATAMNRALRGFHSGSSLTRARRRSPWKWRQDQGQAPPSEQAYRMGGEEFALLTPETSTERVAELAESIMRQVREVRHRANPGGQITCSVGTARRLGRETPQLTLRRADMALMQAKANGRDRVEVAETGNDPHDTGLHRSQSRPAQPLMWEAIHASLSLAALDRDLTPDDWTRLLQAAILSVPAAESGTINVRQGSQFVLCAQIGFDDRLLDLRHTEREQLEWYGLSRDAWLRGQPRVLYGEQIALQSDNDRSASPEIDHSEHFRVYGRLTELKASLCIPVLMDGEVVGHLNLDHSSDGRAFDEEDLRVARAFADQVTVLTVAARRRSALEHQRREQNWLLNFSLQLLTLPDPGSIAGCLLRGLSALYGLQGKLVLGALPVVASGNQAEYVLALDWPGNPYAHLLLSRAAGFGAQDRQLLEQAARAANAALDTLQIRASVAG